MRYTKDGKLVVPKHIVVDEFTFRTDLSRQRKYQLRKRKQNCCVTCGVPTIADIYGKHPEKCDTCRANTRDNRKGILQGRRERDSEVGDDVEGLEP